MDGNSATAFVSRLPTVGILSQMDGTLLDATTNAAHPAQVQGNKNFIYLFLII